MTPHNKGTAHNLAYIERMLRLGREPATLGGKIIGKGVYEALSKGVPAPSLVATTTGTGVGFAVPITSKHLRVQAVGVGTINGGTILVEEAANPASVAWAPITDATFAGTDLTAGATKVLHLFGTYGAVRARVSANLTGGGLGSVEFVSD